MTVFFFAERLEQHVLGSFCSYAGGYLPWELGMTTINFGLRLG